MRPALDRSFGHIHAVNVAQQTSLVSKRVGYLASTVCLNSAHELTTLLVNTFRRDLKSSNHMEASLDDTLPYPNPTPTLPQPYPTLPYPN